MERSDPNGELEPSTANSTARAISSQLPARIRRFRRTRGRRVPQRVASDASVIGRSSAAQTTERCSVSGEKGLADKGARVHADQQFVVGKLFLDPVGIDAGHLPDHPLKRRARHLVLESIDMPVPGPCR